MLCRPMTAAGFGLPFGAWFLWSLLAGIRRQPVSDATAPASSPLPPNGRLRRAVCLTIPLVVSLAAVFYYDRTITGNDLVSPDQLDTDTYTPRHGDGFNNVVRGERRLGPKVLDNYDRWAENLTPRLAAENVARRAAASARWTLGIVPLATAPVVFVLAVRWRVDWRWRRITAAVVTLHAVNVPYWFVGIMNWHCV
jgi:hypothetical protein